MLCNLPPPFAILNGVKHLLLLCTFLSFIYSTQAAPATPDLLPHTPKVERVEGTVTVTRNGITSRAKLQFQAPNQLRIDIEANDAALVPAQTIVATGDETRLFYPATKRLSRLPYNITQEWWHSWELAYGGPAAFILFGLPQPVLDRFYTMETIAAPNADSKAVRLVARPDVGRFRVQDIVHFGGKGTSPFYAASKRLVFDLPTRIELTSDTKTNSLTSETVTDENGRVLLVTELVTDTASGLPKSAVVRDGSNHQIAQFAYDLKPRAEAFPVATFGTDLAPGQIIEDLELKPLGDYQNGQDAAARFNLGVALARHTEDFPAAFTAWDAAAQLQPQAVAPHFAIFDAAIQTRDFPRAQRALNALSQLLGTAHFEVATHRANLAIARRDWDGAKAALDAAQQAQPQNGVITLARANLARARGDFATTRSLLLEIINNAASQSSTQADAGVMLANITLSANDAQATQALFMAPNNAARGQLLTHDLLDLLSGKDAPPTTLDDTFALAALAVANERAGKYDTAIAAWQRLVEHAPQPETAVARMHLMALQAQRGAVAESLKLFHDLIADADDESARSRIEDALLTSWRKAYRQDELRAALQQRVIALNAPEAEWHLWLAYQESYGTDDDVASIIQSALTRFPRSAWWQSRWAEYLADQAASQPQTAAGLNQRDQNTHDALQAMQTAIEADPKQPLYQVQRTLILTQRASLQTAVMDASKTIPNLNAAHAALDDLKTTWKDDPDVQIAIGVQEVALEPGKLADAVDDLQAGLRAGRPGRETTTGDRHTTASSVHQTLASALRRLRRPSEAAHQYEILLESVRDGDAELGIARNYLILLIGQKNVPAIAALMTRLVREPWPYSSARDLVDGFALTLAQRGSLAIDVVTALRATDNPAARLAETQLDQALLQVAQAVAAAPKATAEAKATPASIAKAVVNSMDALEAVAKGRDKLLAGRAAALLAENALSTHQFDQAINWLQIAVDSEPRNLDLRLALAAAYRLANQPDGAIKARNDILSILPRDIETLHRAAILSGSLKQPDEAARYAVQAMNLAQVTPDASPVQLEDAAITAARSLFDNNQIPRAVEIYNNLAAPQWDSQDRAVSLADLEQHQRKVGLTNEADQTHAQLTALKLTATQLQSVAQVLKNLD